MTKRKRPTLPAPRTGGVITKQQFDACVNRVNVTNLPAGLLTGEWLEVRWSGGALLVGPLATPVETDVAAWLGYLFTTAPGLGELLVARLHAAPCRTLPVRELWQEIEAAAVRWSGEAAS